MANHISIPENKLASPALELFDTIREQSGICASLAHCRGLVLAGLAPGPIGVDCERAGRNRNWSDMADMYFSKGEAQIIRGLPEEQTEAVFLRYWTLKESMVKAVRGSVLTDLNRLVIESWETPPRVRTEEKGAWFAWQGQHAGCSAAMVCALPEPPYLRLIEWPVPGKPDDFARVQTDELVADKSVFRVQ